MEKNIGLKIRKVRELKNFSQSYVADKLSVSQASYSELENGKVKVSTARLNEIAKILDVSPEVIEGFSDSVVFNSCIQSGQHNTYHINPIEKIDELYNELIEGLKNQITALNATIAAKDALLDRILGEKKNS